jgi:hypothetical protein
MAAFKPELFSIEEVINFYELTDGSEYKVYAGTSPNESYKRFHFMGDKENGLQELTAALVQLQNRIENTNAYLIQIITPSKSKGKLKTDSLTSISFQLNRPAAYQPQVGGVSNRTEMLLEKMCEQNSLLLSRLNTIDAEQELEFDEPEQETGLGAILNNPQIQTMLIGAVSNFLNGSKAVAIAGINNQNDIDAAMIILQSLMDKGVSIEHLKKLDDMSTSKLNNLLLML